MQKKISQNKIPGSLNFKNKSGFSLLFSPWGFLGRGEQNSTAGATIQFAAPEGKGSASTKET